MVIPLNLIGVRAPGEGGNLAGGLKYFLVLLKKSYHCVLDTHCAFGGTDLLNL